MILVADYYKYLTDVKFLTDSLKIFIEIFEPNEFRPIHKIKIFDGQINRI